MTSSGETSPSLLNLREFRISKKASLSHNKYKSNDMEEDAEVKNIAAAEIDIDSDDEVVNIKKELESLNASAEGKKKAPVEVKNIATAEIEIDSDDEVVSIKQERDVVNTSGESKMAPTAPTVDKKATAATTSNGIVYQPRNKKNPKVIEKEKQMKFLLETFPKVDAMLIHNVLSRHNFDQNLALAELTNTHGKEMKAGEYEKWRKEQEHLEQKKAEQQSSSYAAVREQYLQGLKRKAEEAPVAANNVVIKRKVKRKKDGTDTDESSGEAGDYKDSRVYDSDADSDAEISNELTTDKKRVLEFFRTAVPKELQLMSSCSRRKIDQIIELRPFNDWVDLVQKLQSNRSLSGDLLNAAQQVIATRNNVRVLMKKCTNLAQQLEKAVAEGAGVKEQPKGIAAGCKLTSYQMVGLNWLAVLHAQDVNGILADEMGLGKTVQVIAFLAYLKETGGVKGTHLIVVPSSTLDNWKSEFERWCPSMRIFMYYGSTEERKQFRVLWSKGGLADYDVILTTYTMVGNSPEERKMFRITKMHYVVFDEAHMLKNMNTQRYENLIRINAPNRILLTGTPLQNNLLELMSLLIFVMPKIFAEKADDLKNLFQKNGKTKDDDDDNLPTFEKEQIEQAKRIMKPFVLRRLKQDVLQDLPTKTDELVEVPMATLQKQHYEKLVNTFQKASREGSKNGNYNGVTMMSDLRKLSNHPVLLRYYYKYEDLPKIAKKLAADASYKDTKVQYIVDDLAYMSDFEIHTMTKEYSCIREFALPESLILSSGKFEWLDAKLDELKEEGHRVLIFSQYVILLNVLEEYLKIRDHSYLRLDGSTPVNIRQQLIDEYTEDESIFIFLLSTKAGGLGINLTAADTVIIHDIDFNPYNDKQAEDRCHRMGQTRPVDVYRLISKGTIEEGMWQMNLEKLKLEKDITTEDGDNPDVKSVVRLLSSVLGIDSSKATELVSPKKKS